MGPKPNSSTRMLAFPISSGSSSHLVARCPCRALAPPPRIRSTAGRLSTRSPSSSRALLVPWPSEARRGERNMSTNSKAGSDPVDLEKKAAVEKAAAAEELAVVDQRKAYWIRRSLDIFFVVYLLFSIGVVAAMVRVSNNWWDPWPGVLFMSPICIGTLYLTPKMKDVYIRLYATKQAPSCSDLTTKLLGSQK